jgi:hypothetical protein
LRRQRLVPLIVDRGDFMQMCFDHKRSFFRLRGRRRAHNTKINPIRGVLPHRRIPPD